MKPFPENRCTASQLCRRPGMMIEGLPRRVCLAHASKQGKSRYGVTRTKGGRSKSEANRAFELDLACKQKGSDFRKLQREVWFELRITSDLRVVPSWKEAPSTEGVCIDRLYMDFVYERRDGRKWRTIYEDHKAGLFTDTYKKHKKWFEVVYGPIYESGKELR